MLQRDDLPGTDALAKAYRIHDLARTLKESLPGQLRTAADARAYAVWWATEERGWAAHKVALEEIFGTVEDDTLGILAARRQDLDELGRRIHAFADFCTTEIRPLLDRLEKGLNLLEGTPTHPDAVRWLQALTGLRGRVRQGIPTAWSLASPAAHHYRQLPEELRKEAEKRWGPLTGTDPHDFSPMWHTHFRGAEDRLRSIDERLKLAGGNNG